MEKESVDGALIFYDTSETTEEERTQRLGKTAERLLYHRDTPRRVVSANREKITPHRKGNPEVTFSSLFGCAHPKKEQCMVCAGEACETFDEFVNERTYGKQLEVLQKMRPDTFQEADDNYTFFNMLWDIRRRQAVQDYLIETYPIISDRIHDIKLTFRYDLSRWNQRHASSQPHEDFVFDPEETGGEDVKLKPYCNWIYVPRLDTTDEDHYGIHFVDVTLPLLTQTVTYLTQMLNPRREFVAQLLSVSPNDTRKDDSVRKAKRETIQNILPHQRRSSSPARSQADSMKRGISLPDVSISKTNSSHIMVKQKSDSSLAVRHRRLHSPHRKTSNTTLKLKRTLAMKNGNEEVAQKRELERFISDPRPAREERLKKFPELKKMFERGFPRIILISDSPVLEKRPDYKIRANKKYSNVFSLETPKTRTRPEDSEKW